MRLEDGLKALRAAGFDGLEGWLDAHLDRVPGWTSAAPGDIAAIAQPRDPGGLALGIVGDGRVFVLSTRVGLDVLDLYRVAGVWRP